MSKLVLDHLSKQYPGCRALDDVSVTFESGKVNALLGKNGSGKSTMIKCIAGVTRPTSGGIYLDERKLSFSSPSEANRQGIAVVYQEMSLIPWLTVTENIFLGRLPKRGGLIDWNTAHRQAQLLLQKMKADIDPHRLVADLSMWQCQVVEITKSMSFQPRVLMLDEPTSALASHEVSCLFDVIRELKKQDIIIIYISHKLHEIPEISDTITVIRDGQFIGKVNADEIDNKGIIHMMFGNVTLQSRPKDLLASDEKVLEVRDLCRKHKFSDVSFQLKRGEVLGIAGMLGAGRTELLKSIFGADPFDSGEILVKGEPVKGKLNPIKMKRRGLGLTPEDRKKEGLILIHPVADNLCYASWEKTSRGWLENHAQMRSIVQKQIRDLAIKVPDVKSSAGSLSGGNQQKVVVGNWLNTEPSIMLYDEPTRGIDVNAKQQIFEIMWNGSRQGISTIFVSSELEELIEVCHRILIMREGRIVGEVTPDHISVEELYAICMEDIDS